MSCPSKVPFKFSLPFQRVKIEFMYKVLLKFMFSKKATQTDKNIAIELTLTTWCQIISEDFVNFCGPLRKYGLYSTGFNYFYSFFREKSMFHVHRLWKIVAAVSLSMEFSSRREQPFKDSNQTMCEKSDPALFWRKW